MQQTTETGLPTIARYFPETEEFIKSFYSNKTPNQVIRLNQLLFDFSEYLSDPKQAIDVASLISVQGKEVLKKLFELVMEEEQSEKIVWYALFMKFFAEKQFVNDTNKLDVLDIIRQLSVIETWILRNTIEWMVLAYGRMVVKRDYDPAEIIQQKPTTGCVMEAIVAGINVQHASRDTVAAAIKDLSDKNIFELNLINGDNWYRPSLVAVQAIEYLGIPLSGMPEQSDLKKPGNKLF